MLIYGFHLRFWFGFHIRYWVDCKNGGRSVAVIIHYCGICNATISISDSRDGVGVKYFFSTALTGPVMSYYRGTPGNSVDNSGWLPWSGYIRPSRSSSVSQYIFSLVQFLNSKFAPYSVFLDFPPHLLTVFMTCCGIGYSVHLHHLRMCPVFRQNNFQVPLRVTIFPKAIATCVLGVMVLEGSGSSCNS